MIKKDAIINPNLSLEVNRILQLRLNFNVNLIVKTETDKTSIETLMFLFKAIALCYNHAKSEEFA